jgi:hypothetical protein
MQPQSHPDFPAPDSGQKKLNSLLEAPIMAGVVAGAFFCHIFGHFFTPHIVLWIQMWF